MLRSGYEIVCVDIPLNMLTNGQKFTPPLLFHITATEAHDDDGLPHTLEHLVFMGSEDYPYKV